MTTYQMRVLETIAEWENSGSIEISLQMYGPPTALQQHNVERAIQSLQRFGFVDANNGLTEKGSKFISRMTKAAK